MYYSEELTPEMARAIQAREERREYKTGPGSRIVLARVCNHCDSQYFPRRKNQKYCCNSCRVMACYKRKGYKYKSGRYEKDDLTNLPQKQNPIPVPLIPEVSQPKGFDWGNFKESAAASASVETAKYFLHDRPLMQKIDKLLRAVEGKNFQGDIKYLGVQHNNGKPISIFQDSQGFTIVNDVGGRWFKMISRIPVKWVAIPNPL
jgi:hypothetical protein